MKTKYIIRTFQSLIIVLVMALSSCSSSSSEGISSSYPKDVTIEYRMSGTPNNIIVDRINYTNETGGDTNLTDVTLPFSKVINKRVEFAEIFTFLGSLNNNKDTTVILEIIVNGKSVEKKSFINESIPIVSYQFE